MEPDNPYAAPEAPLIEPTRPAAIGAWTVGQLRLLAALSAAAVLGTLVMSVLLLTIDPLLHPALTRLGEWMGPLVAVLGCYLLIRFKQFVETRFEAPRLAWPVWSLVVVSLVVTGLEIALGDAMLMTPGWAMLLYFATVALYGLVTVWFGIRLLRVHDVYAAVRVLAWLAIVGGAMLASVILVLAALVPLLGVQLAMTAVFLRGASERRALGP